MDTLNILVGEQDRETSSEEEKTNLLREQVQRRNVRTFL